MLAAFVALGQALIDAVGVGLVGDNEDTGLRRRGGDCEEGYTSQERRKESHAAPMSERGIALIR